MASQHSIADPGVSRSILAVDGESDSETRRLHARTRGSVNALTVEIVDASGTQVTSFGGAGGGDGAILDGASSSIKATVRDYTNSNPLAVSLTDATGDAIATLPISAAALPLPTGAATAANQQTDALTNTQLRATAVPVSGTFFQATQPVSGTVTANLGTIADVATQTTLALIKAKTDNIPAQGQALAASSVPVVLTAAQETALTPPAAITGFATSAKQDTIIGHVDGIETLLGTIDTDTGAIATSVASIDTKTPALGQALAAASVPVILPAATITTLTPQTDALTNTQLRATAVPVSGTFYQATQPVSAASLPLPSGASTSALQGGGLPAALGAGGGLKVDGSGTALPVSLASVPSHAVTNAGTFAVQVDGSALTALQLIDDIVGALKGPGSPTIDSYTTDDVNLAANTADQAVVAAPGANKQIWVYGLVGSVDVAGSISIQDEDNTALSGVMPVAATGGFVMNPSGNFAMPWIKVATNKALEIDTVTCTFDGTITYAIVSV
jgi:hypothetical protein